MTIETALRKLSDLKSEFAIIDAKVKYEANYISHAQLKVFRKLRANMRKQIKELELKIDLLS